MEEKGKSGRGQNRSLPVIGIGPLVFPPSSPCSCYGLGHPPFPVNASRFDLQIVGCSHEGAKEREGVSRCVLRWIS